MLIFWVVLAAVAVVAFRIWIRWFKPRDGADIPGNHRVALIQANTKGEAVDVGSPYKLTKTRHGWMLVNPNDFFVGRAILEYGEFSEFEGQFLVHLLSTCPGKVVEVGANIGTHTIPLANALELQGRRMEVFEPQPFIFQNLCANLALNGISNVKAWPWACGARQELISFPLQNYATNGNFGGVSMIAGDSTRGVSVPCVRLDDVLDDERIGLMKIDVEGFELLVLQGADTTLARWRPVLYVENDRIEQSAALIEWLFTKNYRLWWHITPLFNPDNFFGNANNIYGNIASFNMVCIPREMNYSFEGEEISDPGFHPLRR